VLRVRQPRPQDVEQCDEESALLHG
jgi:hypothetical protein